MTLEIEGDSLLEAVGITNNVASGYGLAFDNGATGRAHRVKSTVTATGTIVAYFVFSSASATTALLENCLGYTSGGTNNYAIWAYDTGGGSVAVTVRGGYYSGDVVADGNAATIVLDGPIITGSITTLNSGTITGHYYDANSNHKYRSTSDTYPQQSTYGLNARFERLFGDDKPANTYQFTRRTFLVNAVGSNIIGFEDDQASPYVPPAGNFTITTPANTTTASSKHWLDLFNQTSATPCYLQWTSTTAKNNFVFISAISPAASGTDFIIAEARFWDVQTPTANDRWWALRWNWYGSTKPQFPFQISAWYSAAVGDGLTFAYNTGTQLSESPTSPGQVCYCLVTVNAGPTMALNVDGAEGFNLYNSGAIVASMPASVKTARLMSFQNYNQFFVDQLQVT